MYQLSFAHFKITALAIENQWKLRFYRNEYTKGFQQLVTRIDEFCISLHRVLHYDGKMQLKCRICQVLQAVQQCFK